MLCKSTTSTCTRYYEYQKRSTPDVDADTEAERGQDAQANSQVEEIAVSGCPHPAALVPTGQANGSAPAAGHEDLLPGAY